jgi:hypothetical protein
MSADNWTTCPNCKKLASKKIASSYGKVTEDEYLAILEDNKKVKDETTLREDYEILTDEDGFFYISYVCSCSVCKFHYEYKYKKEVLK